MARYSDKSNHVVRKHDNQIGQAFFECDVEEVEAAQSGLDLVPAPIPTTAAE